MHMCIYYIHNKCANYKDEKIIIEQQVLKVHLMIANVALHDSSYCHPDTDILQLYQI